MPEAVPTLLYTTRAYIESTLGQLGVLLRLDDDDDGTDSTPEDSYLDDIIADVTDVANEMLGRHYDDVSLESSLWVRRRCTEIAIHYLSRRRANAPIFVDEYNRAIDDFRRVQNGLLYIPRLTPKHDFLPSLSNQRVDYRYQEKKLRTISCISTGKQSHRQDLD